MSHSFIYSGEWNCHVDQMYKCQHDHNSHFLPEAVKDKYAGNCSLSRRENCLRPERTGGESTALGLWKQPPMFPLTFLTLKKVLAGKVLLWKNFLHIRAGLYIWVF